jgi:hypothetical protein
MRCQKVGKKRTVHCATLREISKRFLVVRLQCQTNKKEPWARKHTLLKRERARKGGDCGRQSVNTPECRVVLTSGPARGSTVI